VLVHLSRLSTSTNRGKVGWRSRMERTAEKYVSSENTVRDGWIMMEG